MSSRAADRAPNIQDHRPGGSEWCWLRHPVSQEDTMTRLALRYDTSIGHICRANRMHWQDVLQTRSYIWVPVPIRRHQLPIGAQECQQIPARNASLKALPPHFYRQSAPNANHFAEEGDPLLITTKITSSNPLS
ncbi:uncharacterized protein LOC108021945 [Drosophila biarmipes]|uniref:uncharacterized protein LOC108021945 n=1 Tax=Drosophila biarmipes TaxID=125945 RepID=UPI0007E71CE4|nr:uncharacterized protein LOC108021945 [Drosophila biarmipes]